MRISTKFSVAVHALILIAIETLPCTSQWIAGSVNTNPVVIRRIVSRLIAHGMVEGGQGKSGYRLLVEPSSITLLSVYRAMLETESDQLFSMHTDTNIQCLVGASIQLLLEGIMTQAQEAMEGVLAGVTLDQLIAGLKS